MLVPPMKMYGEPGGRGPQKLLVAESDENAEKMLEPGATMSGLIRRPLGAVVGPRPENAIISAGLLATRSAASGAARKRLPVAQATFHTSGIAGRLFSVPPTQIPLRKVPSGFIVVR